MLKANTALFLSQHVSKCTLAFQHELRKRQHKVYMG